MKIERRIKFTRETTRKISFAVKREPLRFFCQSCDAPSEMLSINEAAKQAEKIWSEIVSSIVSGELHSTETEAGEIYICGASLSKISESEKSS